MEKQRETSVFLIAASLGQFNTNLSLGLAVLIGCGDWEDRDNNAGRENHTLISISDHATAAVERTVQG